MAEMCQQMASRVTLCAYCLVCLRPAGRDGADGIVTRCGLDGPGIESPWGGETGHGTQQPSCTMGTGSSPGKGGGLSGRSVALTTHAHLAPKLKKE